MFSKAMQQACGVELGQPQSAALMLATRIEAHILDQAGSDGAVIGDHAALARKFEVSPKILKQALRIIEGRELGHVRRGNGGGLIMNVPPLAMTAQLMALYFAAFDMPSNAVDVAKCRFDEQARAARPATKMLMDELFASLRASMSMIASGSLASANRAVSLARRIVIDGRRSRLEGSAIGTIDDLCERYATGVPVTIQAIRILEDMELIATVRGRGGGMRWTTPTPLAIVRRVFAHLHVRQLSVVVSSEIIWCINGAFAKLAAQSPNLDRALMAKFRDNVTVEPFLTGDRSAQVALFRAIADVTDEHILHTLAQCLFFYELASDRLPHPSLTLDEARALVAATHAIADRILAGDPAGAVAAVEHCHALSGEPAGEVDLHPHVLEAAGSEPG